MNFNGKVCLVTGAAGNLGRAVANAFESNGASLVLVDHDGGSLRAAYGDESGRKSLVRANLLDASSVEQALGGKFSRIDILCNIAGGFRMGEAVHETSESTWDLMLGLNARSVINVARIVVPGMIAAGYGKIVNIAALAGLAGKAHMGAYSASKAAVIRLTESMSAELRGNGINVNCILPSTLDTPQNRAAMPDADPTRWVAPEALAEVVMFLTSEGARAIHGAAIPVNGLV